MMEILVREDGETTIYRGRWGGKKQTKPIFNFAKGWGLDLSIEFPSDWHEDQLAILRITLLWGRMCFYFPWYKSYEDHYQCSGPQYGFSVTSLEPDGLLMFLYYGNDDGTPKGSRVKILNGPWSWGSSKRLEKGGSETFDYTYQLKSGEIQERKATVRPCEQEWRRFWLPHKKIVRGIDVQFDGEVGEKTGSWKGGTIGCGYSSLPNETPEQTLRRMERERKF